MAIYIQYPLLIEAHHKLSLERVDTFKTTPFHKIHMHAHVIDKIFLRAQTLNEAIKVST